MRIAEMTVLKNSDLLRRFTATHHAIDLAVMDRKIHLETNDARFAQQMLQVFQRCSSHASTGPDYVWKLVAEDAPAVALDWLPMCAFSSGHLRYASFGMRSFIASNLASREVVGFLPSKLVEDRLGLTSVFLGTLVPFLSSALGLTTVSSACVGQGSRCMLVFGPPRSGKTTSSYLATKHGLQFHGDQNTFLELRGSALTCWGQPWPAAFRPEAPEYLPELGALTRRFICGDMEFLCLDLGDGHASVNHRLTPLGSVFLERESAKPAKLIRMDSDDTLQRLRANVAFQEDASFDSQTTAVLSSLSQLPAYRLLYGSDPAEAAVVISDLVKGGRWEKKT